MDACHLLCSSQSGTSLLLSAIRGRLELPVMDDEAAPDAG
jgi:hypothetical protein